MQLRCQRQEQRYLNKKFIEYFILKNYLETFLRTVHSTRTLSAVSFITLIAVTTIAYPTSLLNNLILYLFRGRIRLACGFRKRFMDSIRFFRWKPTLDIQALPERRMDTGLNSVSNSNRHQKYGIPKQRLSRHIQANRT